MPPLNLLIKPASGCCNMRCRYCFYADETSRREVRDYGMMPEDVLETLTKKALAYAIRNVVVQKRNTMLKERLQRLQERSL